MARTLAVIALAGGLIVASNDRGSAQSRLQPGAAAVAAAAPPAATGCTAGRALGVSRVLEVDTTGGPRFGHQQYKEHDILRDHEIVLTFDDGPLRRNTRAVLDALAAHCTRATFFMVGKMAMSDPELVREIARRGHTIGTHTMSHRNMRAIGASKAEIEIEQGISAVSRALGKPVAPFFRFPFLADSPAMTAHLQRRNFGIFSIDVDAIDYRAHDGSTVHRNVMSALAPLRKGILLFHDIQPATAAGLRSVLDDLAAKGYKVVHLVPKTSAATLAGFDSKVGVEGSSADRAKPVVIYPVKPQGASALPPAKAALAPQTTAPQPAPVQQAQPASPQASPPATSGALRGTRDDDWRRKIFND